MTAVQARLQAMADAMPGLSVFTQPVQDIQIGTRVSRTQYQYTLVDTDAAELATWAPRLLARAAATAGLRNVATDQQDEGLVTKVTVDREAAQRLGVSMQTIQDVLYDSFGQRQISTIFSQANQYRVVLEADPSWQADPASLLRLRVPGVLSAQGQSTTSGATVRRRAALVPLSAVATDRRTVGPLAITHEQQFPSVTLSFDLAAGTSLGDAVAPVQRGRARYRHAGNGERQLCRRRRGVPALARLRALADPGRGGGDLHRAGRAVREHDPPGHDPVHPALGRHRRAAGADVFGLDLSLVALVGIVLLMGIVKKNAIMMIDFARGGGAHARPVARKRRSRKRACCASARS